MKKMTYHFTLVILSILILVNWSPLLAIAGEKEVPFTGDRTTTWTISQSDLSNYFDGGRYTFEILTRSSGYPWLKCTVRGVDRNLEITMSFSFSSEEEYLQRVSAMTGYRPSILYDASGDSLTLMEGFTANDLFNWLKQKISRNRSVTEFQTEDLFKIADGVLNLNGNTYRSVDRISVRPETDTAVVTELNIKTVGNNKGGYDRTISLGIPDDLIKEDSGKSYKKSMQKAVGKNNLVSTDDGGTTLMTATFSAGSLEELAQTTSIALNVPVSIHEGESIKDDVSKSLAVTLSEEAIFNSVLAENGIFSYSFTLPDDCTGVLPESGNSQGTGQYRINGQEITYDGLPEAGIIKFDYECGMRFDKMLITTDLSNDFNRVTRSVTWSLPTNIAENYHENIMETLEDALISGTSLKVWDQDGERYYQVTYRSWLMGQLNNFSQKILDGDSELSIQRGLLFFIPGSITESTDPGMLMWKTRPKIMQAEYILPANTQFGDLYKATVNGTTVTFNLAGSKAIEIPYVHTNTVFLLVLTAAALLAGLVTILYIRKQILKRKRKKMAVS